MLRYVILFFLLMVSVNLLTGCEKRAVQPDFESRDTVYFILRNKDGYSQIFSMKFDMKNMFESEDEQMFLKTKMVLNFHGKNKIMTLKEMIHRLMREDLESQ